MAQRFAIVFLTPGQLAGQMHTPRIHCKEHMHTEKTRFQHQIWPQKRGQFPDLQFVPLPIEGWFWGPLIGLRNGPRNAAFFLPFALSFGAQYLVSMAAAATISVCQVGFTTKGSTCSKFPCAIIIRSTQLLRLQAYTHSIYIYLSMDKLPDKAPKCVGPGGSRPQEENMALVCNC